MDFLWISPTLLKWYLPLPLALPLSPTNDRLPNIKTVQISLFHYFIYLLDKYIFYPVLTMQ